jgi:hypothetical protein
MPLNSSNYQQAEDILARLRMDPNSDPNRISAFENELEQYYSTSRHPGSPALAEQAQRSQEAAKVSPGSTLGGYAYEPTVEQFQSDFSRPEVRQSIGFNGSDSSSYNPVSETIKAVDPEGFASLPQTDRYSPEVVGSLGESSPEYKAYATRSFEEAKRQNPNVDRAEEIDPFKNPFKWAGGQAMKLAPLVMNYARSASAHIPEIMATQSAKHPELQTPMNEYGMFPSMEEPISEDEQNIRAKAITAPIRNIENVSPGLALTGSLLGSASPVGVESGVVKAASEGLGYANAGKLARGAIGTGVGTVGALGSMALENVARNPSIEWADQMQDAKHAFLPILGGSALGEIVSQGAGAMHRRARTTATSAGELRNLERSGGGTSIPFGVHGTPEIRANFDAASASPTQDWPEAVAARNVAPKIEESVLKKTEDAIKKISGEVDEYTKHPLGLKEQNVSPVADTVFEMAGRGTYTMPDGKVVSADPEAMKVLGNELSRMGTISHMTPTEAAEYIKQNPNARQVGTKQIATLGLSTQEGKIPVFTGANMNAEALISAQDRIERALGFDRIAGGRDHPVLKEIDRGFRQVRDRFEYPAAGLPTDPAMADTAIPEPSPVPDRRSPNRPTNEQWAAMKKPAGVDRNTPISSVPDVKTEPPPVQSVPAPLNEVKGNKRYQEPSASEYAKIQAGENVDKSGNGYQRLMDTTDIAPGYRLRADKNEISNLEKLAADETALDEIYKANPGISEDEAIQILNAKNRLSAEDNPYTPEFPKGESEQGGWGSPFRRDKSPFSPENLKRPDYEDWSPNEDLYTANPPESLPADSYQSVKPESVKPQSKDELFPDVPDQVGIPDKKELIEKHYGTDPEKVKKIIADTDKLADNLSKEELAAVHDYTGGKGTKVGTPEWESALKKLEIKNPTDAGPIYSGTRMSQQQFDKMIKGGLFSVNKPMSGSFNEGVSGAFAAGRPKRGEVPVVFKIDELDSASSFNSKKLGVRGTTGEREVILNNKDFEISGTSKNEHGDTVVHLKQRPTQLRETLEDGTVVTGFSAKRHQQHKALQELEELKRKTGSTEQSTYSNVLNYAKNPANYYKDQALMEEANKLGLGDQLREVAGTRAFQALSNRANPTNLISLNPSGSRFDPIMMRLDPIFGALSNQPANPFVKAPNTIGGRIQQFMLNQLKNSSNLSGGTGAARYGNEITRELLPNEEDNRNPNRY